MSTMTKQPNVEFQFVNSTIDAPTMPRDQAVRALIRKQAMKKASAARRKDGNYGKHNLRQYPVFVVEPATHCTPSAVAVLDQEVHEPELDNNSAVVKTEPLTPPGVKKYKVLQEKEANKMTRQQMWLASLALSPNPCTSLPATGYELTNVKSDFNILDLSTLASMFASRAVRHALSQYPLQLVHQLRTQKQWSYLEYLPSQYGHYPCLRAATDCVIARARQIISPHENWGSAVTHFYCKALGTLQKALDDPVQRYSAQVLCATEILALFEVKFPSLSY
jgi:hypothetical protein